MTSAPPWSLSLAFVTLVACSGESVPPRSAPTSGGGRVEGTPSNQATPASADATAARLSSSIEEITSFGDNPGGLRMFVHAPAGKRPAGVVLALHGCGQTAADYVRVGWNGVADREGLVIVYAEQAKANNPLRCFRWYDPAHIGRAGEARSLASMVEAAHVKYGTKRAFVTGLSAGGAMTTVMLAAYPELFEAGAVMTGVAYKCASNPGEAFACMKGRPRSAEEWAELVPRSAVKSPRVSIWQGEADTLVRPSNRDELVKQWTKVHGLDQVPVETKSEAGATHALYRDAGGTLRVESWSIPSMGHGVALDPRSGCGTAGPYALDVGLCSTERAAAFFLAAEPIEK